MTTDSWPDDWPRSVICEIESRDDRIVALESQLAQAAEVEALRKDAERWKYAEKHHLNLALWADIDVDDAIAREQGER
jgi:hypothetical protein